MADIHISQLLHRVCRYRFVNCVLLFIFTVSLLICSNIIEVLEAIDEYQENFAAPSAYATYHPPMTNRPGDKVFAKIKGFSNWPARINPLPPGVQVPKGKLPVFFYGTYQVSFVPVKNIVPYEKFKEKWGKLKSSPQFTTAMEEIESNPGIFMLGEDPRAETFLHQFYKFKPSGNNKVSLNSPSLPSKIPISSPQPPLPESQDSLSSLSDSDHPRRKPASPQKHISTDKKRTNHHRSPRIKHREPSETSSEEVNLVPSKSDELAPPVTTSDDNLDDAETGGSQLSKQPSASVSTPLSETEDDSVANSAAVEPHEEEDEDLDTETAASSHEARKVARKIQKKAEKKALKKAAKREAKRLAKEAERADRRAHKEARRQSKLLHRQEKQRLLEQAGPSVIELTGALEVPDSWPPPPGTESTSFAGTDALSPETNLPYDDLIAAELAADELSPNLDRPTSPLRFDDYMNPELTTTNDSPINEPDISIDATSIVEEEVTSESSNLWPIDLEPTVDDTVHPFTLKRPLESVEVTVSNERVDLTDGAKSSDSSDNMSDHSGSSGPNPRKRKKTSQAPLINGPAIVESVTMEPVICVPVPEETIPVTLPEKTIHVTLPEETIPVTLPEETIPVTLPEETIPVTLTKETIPVTLTKETIPVTLSEERIPVTMPEVRKPARKAPTSKHSPRSRRRRCLIDSSSSEEDEARHSHGSVKPIVLDDVPKNNSTSTRLNHSPDIVLSNHEEPPENVRVEVKSMIGKSGVPSEPKPNHSAANKRDAVSRRQGKMAENHNASSLNDEVAKRSHTTASGDDSLTSQLSHLCRDLKASLVRGHENFTLAVQHLTQLATLPVRLPQLAQTWDLMDCIKKCRRYKLSSEVRDAAQKTLRAFQTVQSNASKDEITQAQALMVAHQNRGSTHPETAPKPSKQPPESLKSDPTRTQPSPTQTVKTTESVVPSNTTTGTAANNITTKSSSGVSSLTSDNSNADLAAKVDNVLSLIRATEERITAASSQPATTSAAAAGTTSHDSTPLQVGTIRASAVAAAAAHMHDEEDEESVVSRVEQVAAMQTTTTTVAPNVDHIDPYRSSSTPPPPPPPPLPSQSFHVNNNTAGPAVQSPPMSVDLDSRIERLITGAPKSPTVRAIPEARSRDNGHAPSSTTVTTPGHLSTAQRQAIADKMAAARANSTPKRQSRTIPSSSSAASKVSIRAGDAPVSKDPSTADNTSQDDELYDLLGV